MEQLSAWCRRCWLSGCAFGVLLGLAAAPAFAQNDQAEGGGGFGVEGEVELELPDDDAQAQDPLLQPEPPSDGDPGLQPHDGGAQLGGVDVDRLRKRNRMLKFHQAIGYVTLGLVAAQTGLGFATLNEVNGSNFNSTKFDRLRKAHLGLGVASFASYWTGASLAIFAPKIDRTGVRDSLTAHKAFAWIHGIGMGILPLYGYLISQNRNQLLRNGNYERALRGHIGVGLATGTALAGAYLSVTIK